MRDNSAHLSSRPLAMQHTLPVDDTLSTLFATRWRRFACMMYEGVLLFGVIFVASYLFDTLTQSRNALMLRHGRQAILFIAIGVYFFMCWRKRGQTLPMTTWNIRLVDRGGRVPAQGRVVLPFVRPCPIPLAEGLPVLSLVRNT